MVKIVVAGGSGGSTYPVPNANFQSPANSIPELAREVLDTLIAGGNHDIVIFSRQVRVVPFSDPLCPNPAQEATAIDEIPRVVRRTVDYSDKVDLAKALQGVHTVLSFVNQVSPDHNDSSQKSLIDACIAAGVKRFAPSEYAWYAILRGTSRLSGYL